MVYAVKFKPSSISGTISPEKAVSNTQDFINTNLLQGRSTATVEYVGEELGLYKLKITVSGQSIESYVTKNGELLFPNSINIAETPETTTQEPEQPQEIPKTDKPNIKLFVMSFCPYGQQAEGLLKPVIDLLGASIDIEPHFVIYSNYGVGGPAYCLDAENKYCSLHGINELNEDVRQLCIFKYNKNKFWDYVIKIDKDCTRDNIETCWETTAKTFSIDTDKIKTCQKDEALTLLANEVTLNDRYSVQGSPTMLINEIEYSGSRSSNAFKTSICSAFTTPVTECEQNLASTTTATGSC